MEFLNILLSRDPNKYIGFIEETIPKMQDIYYKLDLHFDYGSSEILDSIARFNNNCDITNASNDLDDYCIGVAYENNNLNFICISTMFNLINKTDDEIKNLYHEFNLNKLDDFLEKYEEVEKEVSSIETKIEEKEIEIEDLKQQKQDILEKYLGSGDYIC